MEYMNFYIFIILVSGVLASDKKKRVIGTLFIALKNSYQ